MEINLKGRDFLKLLDYSPEEIQYLLDLAAQLKAEKKAGVLHKTLEGKNIALIFEKTSTRTRCSFEVAASDLGMGSTYLGSGTQINTKETIADTARVLAGMYDAIEYRGFEQKKVEELARYSKVPVINGLTNEFHPTQILADFLTIQEHFGHLKGIKLVYMGDAGYNMGDSLMIGAAKMGLHFVACAPDEYYPPDDIIAESQKIAKETGAIIELSKEPMEAVKDADVIYTDVWVSMGEPEEKWNYRLNDLYKYRVTQELMDAAGPDCIFMHCLPAYHNNQTVVGRAICEKYNVDSLEVTDEVFEGPKSVVFQQAENRMHTIKAILKAII